MRKKPTEHDIAFWRAYIEILNERVKLVDKWPDGSITWHPRVVRKLLWYSDIPNTFENRVMAHDWLMENAAQPVPPHVAEIAGGTRERVSRDKAGRGSNV
jgi:hypothetical protein